MVVQIQPFPLKDRFSNLHKRWKMKVFMCCSLEKGVEIEERLIVINLYNTNEFSASS